MGSNAKYKDGAELRLLVGCWLLGYVSDRRVYRQLAL